MKLAFISAALAMAFFAQAAAESLSSKQVFEGTTTTPTKTGAAEGVHLTVQSWGIKGERHGQSVAQEIPLRGFYLVHMLSGEVVTTINGETTRR